MSELQPGPLLCHLRVERLSYPLGLSETSALWGFSRIRSVGYEEKGDEEEGLYCHVHQNALDSSGVKGDLDKMQLFSFSP